MLPAQHTLFCVCFVVYAACSGLCQDAELKRFVFRQGIMAVPIKLILYAPDAQTANASAAAAFDRMRELDDILSNFSEDSEISRLSASSKTGEPVRVGEDLWKVLEKAQDVSRASDGAFDITVWPMAALWRVSRRTRKLYPGRLEKVRPLVDYRLLRLDREKRTAQLCRPGMELDPGGIAKGYVISEALEVLQKRGIRSALVDAGGDIALGDPPPGKPGWRVGVSARKRTEKPELLLTLSRTCIATSGDMWKYVEIDGKRYSHIVDPRTGMGLTDHSQVSVVCPDAMTADALASAVSVLGPKKGLALVEKTPHAAARIVRSEEGGTKVYTSKRWKLLDRRMLRGETETIQPH